MALEEKQHTRSELVKLLLGRLKTFGFGTVLGIAVFLAACFFLLLPLISAFSATSLPDVEKLGLNLGISLTIFGAVLLWVVHPLMGHLHLEHSAQRVAHLCVLFGLSLLSITVVVALVSASLR